MTKGVAVVARLRNTNLPGGSGRGHSGCRMGAAGRGKGEEGGGGRGRRPAKAALLPPARSGKDKTHLSIKWQNM
jgi:hypothetical protein